VRKIIFHRLIYVHSFIEMMMRSIVGWILPTRTMRSVGRMLVAAGIDIDLEDT